LRLFQKRNPGTKKSAPAATSATAAIATPANRRPDLSAAVSEIASAPRAWTVDPAGPCLRGFQVAQHLVEDAHTPPRDGDPASPTRKFITR
jgi:hypothetical protein